MLACHIRAALKSTSEDTRDVQGPRDHGGIASCTPEIRSTSVGSCTLLSLGDGQLIAGPTRSSFKVKLPSSRAEIWSKMLVQLSAQDCNKGQGLGFPSV